MNEAKIERERRRRQRVACSLCGRRGTTGIKCVDGRYVCRKRKGCVTRVCDRVFLDKPEPPKGDMVYLGSIMNGVKMWGVAQPYEYGGQDRSGAHDCSGSLAAFASESVRTLQDEYSATMTFEMTDVNDTVLQAILGPGELQ